MYTGNEIIALIGLSITDNKVIEFVNKLERKLPIICKNEMKQKPELIDLQKKLGLVIGFDYDKFISSQKKIEEVMLFVNGIDFSYDFKKLPFGILDTDNKTTVIEKIKNTKGISEMYKGTKDDENLLCWFNKTQHYWMWISFEIDAPFEVCEISIKTYESPSKLKNFQLAN